MQGLKSAQKGLWRLVDTVLPPRCVVTGDIVDGQGMVAPQVWRDLQFISAPFCACCGLPFAFEMAEGTLCTGCLTDKPPYTTARAALVYDDLSRDMVLKFKHADQTHAVHAFIPWLRRAGADMLAQGDVLIPVPLHRFRLLQRRYNQSALIAQALSASCGLPWLPAALSRSKATPSQGHLGYKERQKNVRNAFAIAQPEAIQGKTVLLIDDVYTTGATVKECSKALLKAGAKDVHVLSVARVVRED